MTRKEALTELLEKVKAGEVARDIGSPLWFEVFDGKMDDPLAAYNGSMDAALSLFEAVLPGWEWGADSASMMWVKEPGLRSSYRHPTGDTPSRALLIAVLEALVVMEEG